MCSIVSNSKTILKLYDAQIYDMYMTFQTTSILIPIFIQPYSKCHNRVYVMEFANESLDTRNSRESKWSGNQPSKCMGIDFFPNYKPMRQQV